MKIIVTLSVFISLLSSCDIIEAPYRKEIVAPPQEEEDSTSTKRIILLEKFTGSSCGPCPEVNAIVQSFNKEYNKRSTVISYHAGNLSRPNANEGLPYDFRTQVGTQIGMNFFNANPLTISTPTVVLDRLNYGNSNTITVFKGDIIQKSIDRVNVESPLNVTLYPWYNPSDRTIEVSGNVIYHQAGTKDYKIALALIENDFQSPQKKADGKIDTSYVHQFVFRTNIPNFAWGEEVTNQDVLAGTIIPYTKSFQLPENHNWNPSKLWVVAYVYKSTDAPILTREVMQSKSKQVSIVP